MKETNKYVKEYLSKVDKKLKDDGIYSVQLELKTGRHYKTNHLLSDKEIEDRVKGLVDYGFAKTIIKSWIGEYYYERD